jgi:KaiC/GvpD/RAD55 family RecA-like ATPase
VCGSAGSGNTLFASTFLINGARVAMLFRRD